MTSRSDPSRSSATTRVWLRRTTSCRPERRSESVMLWRHTYPSHIDLPCLSGPNRFDVPYPTGATTLPPSCPTVSTHLSRPTHTTPGHPDSTNRSETSRWTIHSVPPHSTCLTTPIHPISTGRARSRRAIPSRQSTPNHPWATNQAQPNRPDAPHQPYSNRATSRSISGRDDRPDQSQAARHTYPLHPHRAGEEAPHERQ